MSATLGQRAPRQDNRRDALLAAAARQFAERGFHASSMRDIARETGMLPGSIYYHFPSKDELLVAVYREGVERIGRRVQAALAGDGAPWVRLEAACAAHLETLLDGSAYAAVVVRIQPDAAPRARATLVALRERHETLFRELIEALPPPADPQRRRDLRLLLLGALNWSPHWYRPGGETPARLAARFVALARGGWNH